MTHHTPHTPQPPFQPYKRRPPPKPPPHDFKSNTTAFKTAVTGNTEIPVLAAARQLQRMHHRYNVCQYRHQHHAPHDLANKNPLCPKARRLHRIPLIPHPINDKENERPPPKPPPSYHALLEEFHDCIEGPPTCAETFEDCYEQLPTQSDLDDAHDGQYPPPSQAGDTVGPAGSATLCSEQYEDAAPPPPSAQPPPPQPPEDNEGTQEPSPSLDARFADELTPDKPPDHMRFILGNVGFLPTFKTEPKSLHYIDQLKHFKTNVYMGTETDWNLRCIQTENSWIERTRTSLPRQTFQFAYNRHDEHNNTSRQIGGTFMVALQSAQPRIIRKEVDTTGLGRWTWMRIQGRQGCHTTVISAYRPCKNTACLGSAYMQQRTYWDNRGNHTCPIALFDAQLKDLIKQRLQERDHIIVGIDANEDVRSGKIHSLMTNLGLREAILSHRADEDPPETCNKNRTRTPIDGLFVSGGIEPSFGGYTNYGTTVDSDHRSLWIDVPFTSVLGFNPPDAPPPNPRRLKGKDPKCRDKYIKTSKKKYSKATVQLPQAIAHLKQLRDQQAPKITVMLQHSQCLKQCIALRLEAARKTRHLYDRSYDWSPTWRKHDREVKLWRVAKKRFRQRVRGRFLRKLMREAGNTDCFQLNEEETIIRYTQAKEALEDFKPKAADYRRDHLKALAKSLAEKNNTNEEAELKKLTSQEKQRKLGAKLKQTGKKGKKGLASKLATGPENDPTWTEDKEGVERLSGTENETRFTNCLKDSEFITDEGLLADVGILCTGPAVASILSGEYVPAPHLHKWTKMVLEFMPMPEIIKDNPMGTPNLTTEDHIKGWKKAKEGTASDPRTPDFSHYTSAAYDEALASMDAILREIPMQYGFAPDEWNPMADCSIPKKEDSPRVEEMRTICLMDAAS